MQVVALGGGGLGPDEAARAARARCRAASRRRTTPCRSARGRCPPSRRGTRPCRPSARCTALATSIVTVPTFGFGIRPRGPRTLPIRPTSAHHVGRRDGAVELEPALVADLLDQLLAADEVRAGLARLRSFSPLANTSDAHRLARSRAAARPCRARSGRPGADRRRGGPPARRSRRTSPRPPATASVDRLVERVALLAIDLLAALPRNRLPCFAMAASLNRRRRCPCCAPCLRRCASPPRCCSAVRSGIFSWAISRTCARVTLPTLLLVRLAGALLDRRPPS